VKRQFGKKTAAVFLTLLLCLSAASPASAGVTRTHAAYAQTDVPEEVKKIFTEAERKNSALDSCEGSFTINTVTDFTLNILGGKSAGFTVGTAGTMKAKNAGGDDLQFLIEETAGNENRIRTDAFYKEGYLYLKVGAEGADDEDTARIKTALPVNRAVAALAATVDPLSADISAVRTMEMKKDGDNTVITYTADPDRISSAVTRFLLGSISGDLAESLSDEQDGSSEKSVISSFEGEVTINPDGYYTEKKAVIKTGNASDAAVSASAVSTIDFKIVNPGEPVDFELPEGDDYRDTGTDRSTDRSASGTLTASLD
jgi:hypothetical protein